MFEGGGMLMLLFEVDLVETFIRGSTWGIES